MFLAGPPALQIPYFDSSRLRGLLDTPAIRAASPGPDGSSAAPSRGGVAERDRSSIRSCFGLALALQRLLPSSWRGRHSSMEDFTVGEFSSGESGRVGCLRLGEAKFSLPSKT